MGEKERRGKGKEREEDKVGGRKREVRGNGREWGTNPDFQARGLWNISPANLLSFGGETLLRVLFRGSEKSLWEAFTEIAKSFKEEPGIINPAFTTMSEENDSWYQEGPIYSCCIQMRYWCHPISDWMRSKE